MKLTKGALALVLASAVAGCGDSSGGNGTPTKWLGSARHLRVVGTMMGESLDIDISGPTAEDTANLWCEREYQAPTVNGMPDYSSGHNAEVRVKAPVTVNGQMRLMDLGLKRQDWQDDAPGTVVTVIPRDDTASPCTLTSCTNTTAWLSWTWRDPTTNAVMYKMAAQSGSITLGEYTGTPNSTGLEITENTGDVGAFATGVWSATDSLTISFDANCTKNNYDNTY